jgi:hypothetical protein
MPGSIWGCVSSPNNQSMPPDSSIEIAPEAVDADGRTAPVGYLYDCTLVLN